MGDNLKRHFRKKGPSTKANMLKTNVPGTLSGTQIETVNLVGQDSTYTSVHSTSLSLPQSTSCSSTLKFELRILSKKCILVVRL